MPTVDAVIFTRTYDGSVLIGGAEVLPQFVTTRTLKQGRLVPHAVDSADEGRTMPLPKEPGGFDSQSSCAYKRRSLLGEGRGRSGNKAKKINETSRQWTVSIAERVSFNARMFSCVSWSCTQKTVTTMLSFSRNVLYLGGIRKLC